MKKIRKVMTILMATVLMLTLCGISVFADNTSYSGSECYGSGSLQGQSGKRAYGETVNTAYNGGIANCGLQIFAIYPDGSYTQEAGNSGVGSTNATGYFASIYDSISYAGADHHFGVNGVYYGVRSTSIYKGEF